MDEERLQLEAQWAQLAGVSKWKRLLGAEDRPAWLGPEQPTASERLLQATAAANAAANASASADAVASLQQQQQQQSHQQQQHDEDAPLRARTKRKVCVHCVLYIVLYAL
jgi:hypothetical protein